MPTKPRFKACVLAIAIAALPLFAQAAGLGRLNVMSGLGQPFRGEIDLVAVQPGEIESLKVGLASVEAHTAAQLSYPSPSLGLRLALNKRGDGQYVVQISSAGALDEPVFNLLVDLTWSGGKIQREYTALIDPAGYSGVQTGTQTSPASGATVSRLAADALPGRLVSSAIRQPKVAQRPVRAAKATPASTPASSESDYAVKAGDTLSSIAARVKPEGISLEQVLVGLYQANQDAFDGNMNRLKRGKILHIPSEDAFGAVSKVEAAKEIKMHSANWQSYRHQLASAAVKTLAADSGNQAAGGRITAKVEDKGLQAPSKDKDVLKLSRGAGKDDQANKIRALEEDAAARKKALDEANQRVADLQKNIKQMEEFAALKSKSGAELQQKAEQSKASAPVAGFSQPEVAASVPAATSAMVTASPASEQPKPKKRVIPPPEPAPEPSIVDILLENALPVGGGLAAVLLGVGGLIWSRRRRQPNVFENSLISNGDLKPNTVLGRTGGGVISTQAENSFLTDFSRQGLGTIDTDEVDPIAEADVYMAYGRDAQAEEILKDALVKDPSRQEIRMKLLDIYAARKDKIAFEEVAADIYAATDGKGPLWEQAAYLGNNLDPENALYAKKFGMSEPALQNAAFAGVAAVAAAAVVAPTEPDTQDDVSDMPDQENDGILDFEFEMPDMEPEPASLQASAILPVEEVDLDLDWGVVSSPESGEPEAVPETTVAAVSLIEPDVPSGVSDEMPVEHAREEADTGMMALDLPIDLGAEFDAVMPPVESEAEAETFAADVAETDEDESPQFDVSSFELPDLDLNLDALAELDELDTEAQAIADFNAQLSVSEETGLSLPVTEPAGDEAGMDEIDLKFDFSMDEPVAEADVNQSEVPIDLGLEIGSVADNMEFAADDPVQTKIDLARAYIDMGDVEGAREILQEAEQEGNPAQQNLAKSLLAEL